MRWPITLVFFCSVATTVGAAQKASVAVMPLRAKGVTANAAEALGELLVIAMDDSSGLSVISPQDIDSMLGRERLKDNLGCDDVSCADAIGDAPTFAVLGR